MTIRAELDARGFVVLPPGLRTEELRDPYAFVERLVGERPKMAEVQRLRPVPHGRSFASTRVFTPFHTDSQDFRGAPPALQVMHCLEQAPAGGETRLVDGWKLLATIEREAPDLYRALSNETRAIPFYFGAVIGTTVAEKRGARVVTTSPIAPTDALGKAFAAFVDRAPVETFLVRKGETMLVDNHRMLHGRAAFEGDAREFIRVLAWLDRPLSTYGAASTPTKTPGEKRMDLVIEMMTGVAPAKLAAREGLPEEELYRMRTRAIDAAVRALED